MYVYICIYICIQFPTNNLANNCMGEEDTVTYIEQYYTNYIFTQNEQNLIKRKINKSVTFNEFVSE